MKDIFLLGLLTAFCIWGANAKMLSHKIENSQWEGQVLTNNQSETGHKKSEDSNVRQARGLATVIPASKLGFTILTTLLDSLGSINRKIAIGIGNECRYNWKALNVYFRSGTSDDVLPRNIHPKKALLYPARKTNGPVAKGAVGVLCYYIPRRGKTLCVLFSVPFDYNWYSNWWDVKVYNGEIRANYYIYYKMYYGNPYKGDHSYHDKYLGYGFKLEDGVMTSGGNAELMMKIKC